MKKYLYIKAWFLPFIALFLYSCADENLIDGSDTLDLGEEIEVTFGYNVSGISLLETRGVVVAEDVMNMITNNAIDVLVYNIDEEGEEAFAYHRGVFDHVHNGTTGTFKVRLAKSREGEKYSIDFLFNIKTNFPLQQISIGKKREDIRAFVISNSNLSVTGATARLPMWAGLEPQVIDANTSFPDLHIIRSVARIDIGLNLGSNDVAGGLANFKLSNAGYYGPATRTYYIPERANINGNNVMAPSFHSGYSYDARTTLQNSLPITDDRVIGGLFPGESLGEYSSGARYFSLIISGRYTDNEGNISTQYYRIVLVDPEDPTKRLDILRNHKYRVNILSVNGPGYSNATIAQNSEPNNHIVYELSVHEEGKINHVVYTGSQYLGVSNVYSEHDGTIGTGEIKVKTNATNGWRRVSAVDDNTGTTPTWITFGGSSTGTANTVGTVPFTLRENISHPRSAVVTFTAGALSIPVRILQNGTWYIYSNYQPGMMMRGDGDAYWVSVYGAVPPNLLVRAYSPDKAVVASYDNLIYSGGYLPEASPEEQKLNIMGNASFPMAIRQVQFLYSTDAGTTWVPFTEGPQGKGHFWLLDDNDFLEGRTGRMVALYNMPDEYNWAEAMGIDPSFNVNFFYNTWQLEAPRPQDGKWDDVTCYWRGNHGYKPTHPTGCGDYYEEGYPEYEKGKWRLPTKHEMEEMSKYHLHIGDLPFTGYYWSSSEDTGGTSFRSNSYQIKLTGSKIDYSYVSKGNVNHQFAVRCVYGEPNVTLPATSTPLPPLNPH